MRWAHWGNLESELGRKHRSLARQFFEAKDAGKAEHHYREALRFSPAEAAIHIDFGAMLAGTGRLDMRQRNSSRVPLR